jgi:hypothetical protein
MSAKLSADHQYQARVAGSETGEADRPHCGASLESQEGDSSQSINPMVLGSTGRCVGLPAQLLCH